MSVSNSVDSTSIKFYEDDSLSGDGFIFSKMSGTFQLPVEQNSLLTQIRASNIPTKRADFQAFVTKLVNYPVCDEAIQRVWTLIFQERNGKSKNVTDLSEFPLLTECEKYIKREKVLQTETSPGRKEVSFSPAAALKCVPIEKLLHDDCAKAELPSEEPGKIQSRMAVNECTFNENNSSNSLKVAQHTRFNIAKVRVKQEHVENDCIIEYEKFDIPEDGTSNIIQNCENKDTTNTLVQKETENIPSPKNRKCKEKKKKYKGTETNIKVGLPFKNTKKKLEKNYMKKKRRKDKRIKLESEIKELKGMLEVLVNKLSPIGFQHHEGIGLLNLSQTGETCSKLNSSVDMTKNYSKDILIKSNKKRRFDKEPKSEKKHEHKVSNTTSSTEWKSNSGILPSKQCVVKNINKAMPTTRSTRSSSMKTKGAISKNSSDVIKIKVSEKNRERESNKVVDGIKNKTYKKSVVPKREVKEHSSKRLSEMEDSLHKPRTKFSWQDTIIEIINCKSPSELHIKKLKKKVIAKYVKHRGKRSENTDGKFMRYLEKIPGIVIDQDCVKLLRTGSDNVNETQKRKKSLIVKSVTTTTKYHLVR